MKAERTAQKPFEPVCLILETQNEVDAIYAVLNYLKLCESVGLLSDDWKALEPYRSCNWEKRYESLLKAVRKDD